MEPLEVIASEGNGLLAFRSKLGWCVVGPLSEEKDENKFHWNMISIKDSGTGKVPGQHFTVSDCREDGTWDLIKKTFSDWCQREANHVWKWNQWNTSWSFSRKHIISGNNESKLFLIWRPLCTSTALYNPMNQVLTNCVRTSVTYSKLYILQIAVLDFFLTSMFMNMPFHYSE